MNILVGRNLSTTKLLDTPWEITGVSTAAESTALCVTGLDFMLDAGQHLLKKCDVILATHCHLDHVNAIPHMLLDVETLMSKTDKYTPPPFVKTLEGLADLVKNKSVKNIVPVVFMPRSAVRPITGYVHSVFAMTKNRGDTSNVYNWGQTPPTHPATSNKLQMKPVMVPWHPIGMESGTTSYMFHKKMRQAITTFECHHPVPTLGYGISEIRKNLKPIYRDATQTELEQLKIDGVDICEDKTVNHFVFLGDTTHQVFAKNPSILTYRNVIVECTFFDLRDVKRAKVDKHMHWENLKPIIMANPGVHFILIHFSLKYRYSVISSFFEQELRDNCITNVAIFAKDYGVNTVSSQPISRCSCCAPSDDICTVIKSADDSDDNVVDDIDNPNVDDADGSTHADIVTA
jgi:ribonuclease BN (tRNA processing enzyme)